MHYVCGTCRHSGKITGYIKYKRFGKSVAYLYCDRFRKGVRVDGLCVAWESESGKKIPGVEQIRNPKKGENNTIYRPSTDSPQAPDGGIA